MTTQEVLSLVKAGFTADEIRQLSGADAAPAAPVAAAPAPAAPEEPASAQDPAPPAPDPEPAAPAPDPEPASAPDPKPAPATPAWFEEFVKRNNEEMAAMQRALQITNVRRAAPAEPPQKTPEQLMAEAYRAIVE